MRLVLNGMQSQRDQGHDAALAAIVGTHDEGHVLDRDDDDQRPEEERQAAVDIGGGDRDRVIAGEDLLDRIQRAGADVAVDHPEGGQGQGGKTLAGHIAGVLVAAH